MTPELIERFVSHAKKKNWVERGCFISDRGWLLNGDSRWVSPHDIHSTYGESVIPMAIEMALEAEGKPTPRSGHFLEPERGEVEIPACPLTPSYIEDLKIRAFEEARRSESASYVLPVHMDLATVLGVVANLQLASRHEMNVGPTAQTSRRVVAQIITRLEADGYPATAEFMKLGNDPRHDSRHDE